MATMYTVIAGENALWAGLAAGIGGSDALTASGSCVGKDEATAKSRSARGSTVAAREGTAATALFWGLLLIIEV